MNAVFRGVASVFLVWHLFMMSVAMSKGLKGAPGFEPIGEYHDRMKWVTDPYQWTFGLHQTWPMFAPNPRMETAWLEVEGKLAADGTYVDAGMPHGTPDPHGAIWFYDRSGKLERNASAKKRKYLRAAFVRWICRTHPQELQAVKVTVAKQRTQPPGHALGARENWPIRRSVLEEWRCKGH